MERLEDGPVVVQLRERGVERDQKRIVDAGVADVVADGGYEKGEGVERLDEGGDVRSGSGWRRGGLGVWGDGADLEEKVEEGLDDVDDVAEVVVEDKVVVCGSRSEEERCESLWQRLRSAGRHSN